MNYPADAVKAPVGIEVDHCEVVRVNHSLEIIMPGSFSKGLTDAVAHAGSEQRGSGLAHSQGA